MMPAENDSINDYADKACVLVVDDDPYVVRTLSRLLSMYFTVLKTSDPAEALSLIRDNLVHVVISDQRMPKITGVELLKKISLVSPFTSRILLTGYSDLEAVMSSINESEIYRYINKPWSNKTLVSDVGAAAELSIQLREEDSLSHVLEEPEIDAHKDDLSGPSPLNELPESFDELSKFFDETFTDGSKPSDSAEKNPIHFDESFGEVDKAPAPVNKTVAPVRKSIARTDNVKSASSQEKIIIWKEDISVDCVKDIQEYILRSSRLPCQPVTFDDRKKMENYLNDGDNSCTVMVACLSKFHDDKTYEFLERLKREYPYLVTIVLTPEAYLEQAVAIINNCRAYRYLASPTSFSQFKLSFGSALEYQKRVATSYVLRSLNGVRLAENKYSLPYFGALSKWLSSTFAR